MTEFMFPFLSIEGDREYSDTDFATFYHNIFTNGVIATVREQLRVRETADTGMRVEVMPGAILIQGRQYLTTESKVISVTPGSSSADRTDLIVARLDMMERSISIIYKQGTTNLVRNENMWEMQLARLNIPRNATNVFNQHISDTRADDTVCGYSMMSGELPVSGLEAEYRGKLVEAFNNVNQEMNTSASTLSQFLSDQQATFHQWFSQLQNMLDENQASNLQNQINGLTADYPLPEIEHQLNGYPSVRVLTWEYGLGLTGLGDEPEGLFGGSNVKSIDSAVEYSSRHSLTVSVPAQHAMATPTINKISETDYVLTEGYRTIQLILGGN